MTPLSAAKGYVVRGWAPVPVPHQKKAPRVKGWQSLRITESDVGRYFDGATQDVGILMGEPSAGLTDVDLDCAEAVELAPTFLPATTLLARHWPATGGRHSVTLALAGWLLGAGWTEDEVLRFVEAIVAAAGDDEPADRIQAVKDTAARLAHGEAVTGWSALTEHLDDRVLRAVSKWLGLRAAKQKASPPPCAASHSYRATADGLVWHKATSGGVTAVQLTNFHARIVAEVAEDDGVEVQRRYELEAMLRGRCRKFWVPASQFHYMRWASECLGAGAVVFPGHGAVDRARTAIQLLSGDVPERAVFAHLGWRMVEGHAVYLHANGAIGDPGIVRTVEVRADPPLDAFVLPPPPTGTRLRDAVQASLALLDLGRNMVVAPLLCAVYRSVLGNADFSVHLAGPTGVFKSEVASLAQRHFGARMDARHLPCSWASTANAVEAVLFGAKDCLVVVDDFAPVGTRYDVQRLQRDADRLLRAQGNCAAAWRSAERDSVWHRQHARPGRRRRPPPHARHPSESRPRRAPVPPVRD